MLSNFFKRKPKKDKKNLDPGIDEQYLKFRNFIFELDSNKIVITDEQKALDIWGIMIDIGMPELRYSIVTLVDGTTSVYAGQGGGRIGFGEHPKIAKMSEAWLSVANNCVIEMKATKEFPLPPIGMVRFYEFQKDGKYMADYPLEPLMQDNRRMEDIINSKDCFALLFRMGWTIITEIGIISAEL